MADPTNEAGASTHPTTERTPRTTTAGAFDIRTIIGTLIGIYGLILLVMGLWFTDDSEIDRADGVNLNTRVGIGLLVFAAIMLAWVFLRPLRVPADPDASR